MVFPRLLAGVPAPFQVVVTLTWAWVLLLRALGYAIEFKGTASYTPFPAALAWLGWAFVSVGALVVSWPLGLLLRRAPGFNRVL